MNEQLNSMLDRMMAFTTQPQPAEVGADQSQVGPKAPAQVAVPLNDSVPAPLMPLSCENLQDEAEQGVTADMQDLYGWSEPSQRTAEWAPSISRTDLIPESVAQVAQVALFSLPDEEQEKTLISEETVFSSEKNEDEGNCAPSATCATTVPSDIPLQSLRVKPETMGLKSLISGCTVEIDLDTRFAAFRSLSEVRSANLHIPADLRLEQAIWNAIQGGYLLLWVANDLFRVSPHELQRFFYSQI